MLHKIENGYALALLELSREQKKLASNKRQAKIILNLLEINPAYLNILRTNELSIAERKNLVTKTFGVVLQKTFLHLVFLLLDKNKIKHLPLILKQFISKVNEVLGINEGIVYSKVKLSHPKILEIAKTTSAKLALKVVLVNKIDLTLIGGIRVEVGDQVIDNSISNTLEKIRYELLEESRLT